jgi:hypothetical protein
MDVTCTVAIIHYSVHGVFGRDRGSGAKGGGGIKKERRREERTKEKRINKNLNNFFKFLNKKFLNGEETGK